MAAFALARSGARFIFEVRRFLADPMSAQRSREMIESGLDQRGQNLIAVLEAAVKANPTSPYRALMRHARVEVGDVATSVRREGVEKTLRRLRDAGVYVTAAELEGRQPIERPGLSLRVGEGDFNNPLLRSRYRIATSGLTASPKQMALSIELLGLDAAAHSLFLDAFGARQRPMALWRPSLPGLAGLGNALGHAKLGLPVERWFSHTPPWSSRWPMHAAGTASVVVASRMAGRPIPAPRHVPPAAPGPVIQWLAQKTEEGSPAHLNTTASTATMLAKVAREHGIDLAGTLFRVGGEPYTEAKATAIASTGAHAVCHYSATEVKQIGIACAAPAARDDVHVLENKLAVIEGERGAGTGLEGTRVLLTSLLAVTPVILLNADIGDHAVIERRSCGCALESAGLETHLHTIRSSEKLTSEGMRLSGGALLALVEEVLPARFGGGAHDYQLVEREENGTARILLRASPELGDIDESELLETVLEAVGAASRQRKMMSDIWRDAGTFGVERRRPFTTDSGKVPPLQVMRPAP